MIQFMLQWLLPSQSEKDSHTHTVPREILAASGKLLARKKLSQQLTSLSIMIYYVMDNLYFPFPPTPLNHFASHCQRSPWTGKKIGFH
jgi:hypothetical protein